MSDFPKLVRTPLYRMNQWNVINRYGLFAVMTTERREIVIEGSADGQTWREYEFHYKPGNLSNWHVPMLLNQPRLDWQMWFAALGTPRQNPWLSQLIEYLLQGDPRMNYFFLKNPFPDTPPKYLRAELYHYKLLPLSEHNVWRRESVGLYLPAISL